MINCIDQTTDYSNQELYRFLGGVNIPDFVKTASIEEVKEPQKVKTAYADPLFRLFPINSKARVYVSNAFFQHKKAELKDMYGCSHVAKVETNLKTAAETWGISKELEEFNKVAESQLTEEYQEQGVTIKVGSEDEIELFTIKTASDLAREANHFVANLNNYPFEWRRNISEQFVKVAESLNVDELPELVLKYAGQYYPDAVHVKAELARRMTKLSADNQKRYQDLIGDVENISSKEEFFKLAECLHYTEKNAGLYDKSYYRRILGDPVDQLFTLSFEKVAQLCDVVEMGGEKFASSDLEAVPADIYHQSFGFELDPKSAEAKDILPTMPKADVSLFKVLSGVKPI